MYHVVIDGICVYQSKFELFARAVFNKAQKDNPGKEVLIDKREVIRQEEKEQIQDNPVDKPVVSYKVQLAAIIILAVVFITMAVCFGVKEFKDGDFAGVALQVMCAFIQAGAVVVAIYKFIEYHKR